MVSLSQVNSLVLDIFSHLPVFSRDTLILEKSAVIVQATINLSKLCRSGADGKRAGGKLLAPSEVVGSIPTSDNPISQAGH